MSVRRAKKEIGPAEFLGWQVKIILDEEDAAEREWGVESRLGLYLAKLAMEVYYLTRRVDSLFGKTDMPQLKLDDFLVKAKKTTVPGTAPAAPEMTDDEIKEQRSKRMRAVVKSMLGDVERGWVKE